MDYVSQCAYSYSNDPGTGWLPLPRAASKLLYTLCKIRGAKVVSRFLGNDARLLEEMVKAFELWSLRGMVWEERYVMLLWLGHLVLTPFDLVSVGSTFQGGMQNVGATKHAFDAFKISDRLPGVAQRLLKLAGRYIGAAGKEREAAVTLLIRLVLRPDMRKLGLLEATVGWALAKLQDEEAGTSKEEQTKSIYDHIGVLSFVASLIVAADLEVVKPFLLPIFRCLQDINAGETKTAKNISNSAMGRKLVIKAMRATTVTVLHLSSVEPNAEGEGMFDMVLEEVVGHLLMALADNDTPVRYAASKALSVITVNLEPALSEEVCEAVIAGLEENVLWNVEENPRESTLQERERRDLSSVNALRWHGLVLALSHLLFQRSPLPCQLPAILNALVLALGFEQRSSTGISSGTNVRDAACFGIWSLARRYSTTELLAIDTSTMRVTDHDRGKSSILQIMANELLVAGSLDPSGNIRRGASAALQELIGRHPNIISNGISLVQIVDYHAVALRSRAFTEVAVDAAKLDTLYWDALLNELLDWKGVNAPDAGSRRLAAGTVGLLSTARSEDNVKICFERVLRHLERLQDREVEARHGLLLAAEAIMRKAGGFESKAPVPKLSTAVAELWALFENDYLLDDKHLTSTTLRPELTAEAACSLIVALSTTTYQNRTSFPNPSQIALLNCLRIVNLSLSRVEIVVLQEASQAAEHIFDLLGERSRNDTVLEWLAKLVPQQSRQIGGTGKGLGCLAALGSVYHKYKNDDEVRAKILNRVLACCDREIEIDTKIAALKCLKHGVLSSGGESILVR